MKLLNSISYVAMGFAMSIALYVLAGCATLSYLQSGDVKTAVRIAIVLYVDNDPGKANDVLYVIRRTRDDINFAQTASIADAANVVRKNISWNKLSPIEAIATEALIQRVEMAIQNEIKFAQIPPEKLVLVHNVLDWIEESIILSQYYIATQHMTVREPSVISNMVPEEAVATTNSIGQ